ncbi:MAG: glycosyltransferase family 9 protein [Dysgonamonadaceae bacterium]|jgi:ADP-heptose:LPS heptosyltransferase|nr:glycosyltransferase family 9 protein [Dysgonamonadaceae bacterium]
MGKNKKNSTLVIRLSALGDVAMTIPVVYSVANRYPEHEFIMLTKSPFHTLFINKPDNLIPVAYSRNVWKNYGDKVADLHSVLRSWRIDLRFLLRGTKVAVINKGRIEKNKLIREKNKNLCQLETSIERYQKVFEKLGYDAALNFTSLFETKNKKHEAWIGIAPFAQHAGKIYPLEQMEEVVRLLCALPDIKIFLFGNKREGEILENWSSKYRYVQSVAGKMSFYEELRLMNDLNVMVSMDSANMHLASLVDTPVVSVWGATHPYSGFYGYGQDIKNAIQVDMPCRPCSIYGKKPCRYGIYDCMNRIKPEMIVEKTMCFLL